MADAPTPAAPPRPRGGRLSALVGQSFVYGLGGTVARVASVVLIPVYLAAAGTEEFGAAELVTTAVALTAIVLRLGITTAMTRFTLAEGRDRDWAPVIQTIYAFVLSVSTGAALLGFLARERIADLLQVSETLATIAVAAVWVAMNYDVLARLYRVEQRARAFVRWQLANVALTVALTLVLVLVYDLGAVGLVAGNFAGTALVYAGMTWERRRSVGVRRFDRSLARELLHFSIPLMPTNVAIWTLNFADRVQVQRLAGPVELGQYAAAAKVAAGMMLFLAAFQAAWTPFAHAVRGDEGDEVARRTYAEVFSFWAIAMGWGLAALTLASAPYIALTFPADARDTIPAVPLLAAGVVLYGLYLIVSIGVTITKRTRMTPVIAAFSAGTAIGLNFWFIPAFGIIGAAITTVIGFGLLAGLQWLNARRRYPIDYEWGRVARVALYTAGVIALSLWAIPESGAVGIPARVALALAYPFGLFPLGVLSRDDVRRIPAVWRSRKRAGRGRRPDDAEGEAAVP